MPNMKTMVKDFLSQKRVAVVGVSRSLNKTGDILYDKFISHGYEVVPVNPFAKEYKGVPCYASVKDVPGGVQAAMLGTGPEAIDQVVRECAEAGVAHVWVHGAFGSSVTAETVEFCRQKGINLIPAACPMMYLSPDFGHTLIKVVGQVVGFLPR